MTEAPGHTDYRVLARKYRPASFADLIGQETMVRTLSNAIRTGRLAHAFILTGIRGVGKTTTARIIARALNCIGADGEGGPTVEPCGTCAHCTAIAEDRHVDVLEMDAASRTGVDDIREILDGVLYRPTSARYKIYIIDEVHMLSRNAFNALLKTLEEPPEHVKFIFATTEIRKVPVTVLSRCQRFDLRRVDAALLVDHFGSVAGAEGVEISDGALRMIARAADGSVRDGLSLLDQAIAHSGAAGGGTIGEEQVRDMLGLADRMDIFDLFDALMTGQTADALARLRTMYDSGADPVTVLQDLLELSHSLTRLKVVPDGAGDLAASDVEAERARKMAGGLSMAVLARGWQMLLKGLDELRFAPNAIQAAEMILVRLAYVADLPVPADVVRGMTGAPAAGESATAPAAQPSLAGSDDLPPASPPPQGTSGSAPRSDGTLAVSSQPAPDAVPAVGVDPAAVPSSFLEIVQLAATRKEGMLYAHLRSDVHLVHFERGRLEFRPGPNAPADLAQRLGRFLDEATGMRWMVSVAAAGGQATLREDSDRRDAAHYEAVVSHPLVRDALELFPGAKVKEVRERPPPDAEPLVDEDDDEGDDDL